VNEVGKGRVLAGKYELLRPLGKGAMGEVWAARHTSLGGEVAVKVVVPVGGAAYSASERFQLEAAVSAKLSRKTRHIVAVSDHGEEGGLAYLVMELLEGQPLDQRQKADGQLPLAEVLALVAQLGRALTTAHAEGILHRDVKPANVFVTRDEDGGLLFKLLDFGIARVETRAVREMRVRSPSATGKDMVLGTPSYMSPEQARGFDSLDHRCDVWALAVVAYDALADRVPWDGDTVEDVFLAVCTHEHRPILPLRPDLPSAMEALFARAFTERLAERFQTAQEFVAAFEAACQPALGVAPAPRSGVVRDALSPDAARLEDTMMRAPAGLPRKDLALRLAGVGALFCTYLRGDVRLGSLMSACLARHELPRVPADLGLSHAEFTKAVLHAPATRPGRYTILERLALDECAIARRVEDFAAAVMSGG